MTNEIDVHVGKRIRRRRRLLGLTQQELAEIVPSMEGHHQQVCNFECGRNSVNASKLYELAVALNVPVNYFYEGFQPATTGAPAHDREQIAEEVLSQKETRELVQLYCKLGERRRQRVLELAKALQGESTDAA